LEFLIENVWFAQRKTVCTGDNKNIETDDFNIPLNSGNYTSGVENKEID